MCRTRQLSTRDLESAMGDMDDFAVFIQKARPLLYLIKHIDVAVVLHRWDQVWHLVGARITGSAFNFPGPLGAEQSDWKARRFRLDASLFEEIHQQLFAFQ